MSKFKKIIAALVDDDIETVVETPVVKKSKSKSDESYTPILGDHLQVELFRTNEEDGSPSVYLSFSGFNGDEEADYYTERLSSVIQLIFFESEILH